MQWVDTAPAGLREASVVDLRSDDAVVVLDRSGRCVGTDDASHPILGVASERLLGRPRLESAWRWCDTDGRPFPEEADRSPGSSPRVSRSAGSSSGSRVCATRSTGSSPGSR